MSKERIALETPGEAGRLGEEQPATEIESYQGEIEWHKYTDRWGRIFRFGLVELTDRAGQQFVRGSDSGYRLVIVFGPSNIGQAYAFRRGDSQKSDYLAPSYVQEKLQRALHFPEDALVFTKKLARLLERPTVK